MKITIEKPSSRITGTTIIDHSFRDKLKLTCDEYVVMDFIFNHNQLKRNTFYSIERLYKDTGMTAGELENIAKLLIEKKLLYRSSNGILYTSVLWNERFNNVSKYEELWKKFQARGIKTKGLVNYKKAVAKYPEEKLYKAAIAYLKTKDINKPEFIMSIEKFFDVKNKIFEQYFVSKEELDLEQTNELVYEGKFGK